MSTATATLAADEPRAIDAPPRYDYVTVRLPAGDDRPIFTLAGRGSAALRRSKVGISKQLTEAYCRLFTREMEKCRTVAEARATASRWFKIVG